MTAYPSGDAAQPELLWLKDDGQVPNNPDLPVLLYRRILPPEASAPEARLARHGWSGCWRDGIYPFHHFHSTAHECLLILRGGVAARLGGAGGVLLQLAAGDGVVLPAGTGHRNEGSSGDLVVLGCYPAGQGWDLCRAGEADLPAARRRIAAVALPLSDPFHGADGPLPRAWAKPPGKPLSRASP